ncbi:sodium-dependent serotonin transporter isoform X2 [Nematostella vectensis]|uniref:sodium-dependent serotonin transporter isoform X2 n=1 Tax=Nematostella vectensis TaxID=45351 RepID=UPI00207785E7|nr:sodium-dependent serotonin transporter isoform X2 [Nematostella vectensis]
MWSRRPSRSGLLDGTFYRTRYSDLPQGPGEFKSGSSLALACLGCSFGLGNLWRFPSSVANNCGKDGCLQYLLVWFIFLFTWCIPIIIIEFAVGRYTRKSTLRSFRILVGPWSLWCGAWLTLVTTLISCYYAVAVGWCMYYLYRSVFYSLPSTYHESKEIWNSLLCSHWPIGLLFLSVLLAGLCLVCAVRSIELVTRLLVPLTLVIVLVGVVWSLTLKGAGVGITYLFTPTWSKLRNLSLWVDAASQNAWDTGAGMGVYLVYGTYMTRSNAVVKAGLLLPIVNNLISLFSCIASFSALFSLESPGSYRHHQNVIHMLNNRTVNTGFTFIWMPCLHNNSGSVTGRVINSLYFLCLTLVGLTSLAGMLELAVHTLQDIKVQRKYGLPVAMAVVFLGGIPSALEVDLLDNQDFVWAFTLLISGLLVFVIPIRYGVSRFRWEVINDFSFEDWTLPGLWDILVKYIMPLEAIVLAVFWVYHNHRSWSKFVKDSLLIAVIQWVVLLIALFLINWGWMRWRRSRQRIYVTRPSLHSYGSTEPIPPRPILHEEDSTGDEHPKPDKSGDIVRGARDESRPRSTTKRKKSRHRERPRRTGVEDYFRGSGDKNGRQENDGPRRTSTDNTPRKTGVENSPRGNDIENKPRGTGTEYNLRSTDDESRTRGIDDENRPRGTDDESRPRGTDAESRPRGIDDESGPRGTDDESRPRGTDAKIIPLGTGAAQNEPTPSDGTCAETGELCTHIAVKPRGGFAESSSLDEHGPPIGAVTSGDSEEFVSRDNVSIKSDHYQP